MEMTRQQQRFASRAVQKAIETVQKAGLEVVSPGHVQTMCQAYFDAGAQAHEAYSEAGEKPVRFEIEVGEEADNE